MKTIPASLNMCQNLIYLCSLLNTALNSIIPQGGSPRSTLFVVVMLLVTNVKHSSQSLSPPPPPQPPSQPTSISNHPVFTNTVSSSSSKTVSNPHSRFVSITSSAVSKSTASSVSPNPPGATALNKYAASGVFSNLISSVVSNSSTRNMAAITTTTKPPPTTPTTTTASTAVTTAMTGTTAATTAATTTAATTAAAAIAAAAVPPSVHPHQSSANSSSSTNDSMWCTVGILAPEDPPLHGLGNNATFHATLQAGLTAARDLLQDTCTVLEHVRYVDCTLRSSLLAVFNLSLNPRHVLIGPPCSAADDIAAANIISVIGRPVITWIPLCPRLDFPGQSQDVGQGQEGSGTMAVSSYGRYQSLAQSVLLTLEHFHWTKIASVVSQDEFCSQLYQVMEPLLDSSLTRHLRFDPLNVSSIEQALTTVRHRYRILVTCSSLDAFGDLLSSAERLGMTSESYVIVHVTLGSWREVGEIFKSDYSHTSLSRSVLFVGHFTDRLQRRAATNTGINKAASSAQKNGQFLDYFYDAVLLWAAAQKRAGVGHTPDFVNLTLTGHTGRVEMDGEGVRTRVSRVLHYQDGRLVPVADLSHGRFTVLAPLTWPGGSLPSDTFPSPGGVDSDTVIGAVLGTVFVLLVLLLSLFLIRRWRQDRLSQGRAWQVEDREVKRRHQTHVTSQNGNTYRRRLMRMETRGTLGLGSICSLDRNQLFAPVGNYRGTVVAVKTIQCRSFRLTPDIVTDLNILKDLSHDNLNTFVGAHVEPGNTYVLFKYCAKGSLQDVLENEDITLDWMFKMSFATDLARGMEYLHKSALKSHGNLKSSNCVIDSRWVLKITDFGAVTSPIDDHDDMSHHAVCNALLWTAPELVRLALRSRKGSQKGDVFSFAIVLQEILFRVGPYGHDCSSPEEIIENVKRCGTVPFRPHIPQDPDVPEKALTLMTSCWDESPEQRPEFNVIRKRLLELNGGKKVSVVDNMLSLMETYSSRLEQLVADRTAELAQEKAKTDRLLYQMLPASVAEQLKCGRAVVPEFYDSVSIFFSDIVGFTTIASQSKPLEIVELLNDLYTAFDDVICRRDVYKVETIGDAYMCASGCPRRNGKRHASEIADMALNLVATVSTVQVRHLPSESLQLRVGLHTGPCAAGVVGVAMPRYCLFGDTVNMASRMESTGKALHIHISSDMRAALEELDCGFLTLERGMIQVKGKGVYRTFWLVGREGYNKTLPDTFSKLRQTLGEANSRPPSPSNTSLTVGDGMYSALRKTSLAVSHFTVMSDSDDASTFVPGSPVRSESGVGLNADDYNENDDVFTQNADADGKHVSIGEGADPKLGAIPRIEIS